MASDGSGEIVAAASLVRGRGHSDSGQTPDTPPDFDRRVWDYSGMAKVGKVVHGPRLVIMLAAVAVGVFFAATGFGKVADMAENAFVVEGSVTRDFDAGDEIFLFGQGSGTNYDRPNCQITGPAATKDVTSSLGPRSPTTAVRSGPIRASVSPRPGRTRSPATATRVATPELSATGIFQSVGGILLAVSVVVADWFLWSSEAFCGLSGRAERSLRRRTRRPAATKAIRSRVGIRTIRSRAPLPGWLSRQSAARQLEPLTPVTRSRVAVRRR